MDFNTKIEAVRASFPTVQGDWLHDEEEILSKNFKYEGEYIWDETKGFFKEAKEDIPRYGPDDGTWAEGGGIWGWIKHFRWNLNFMFFGVPWIVVMMLCVTWNLFCNIGWFKWWAGGNFWLMGNSIYLLV